MKLKKIGSNMTELWTDSACVLFSYDTPVAANLWDGGFVRTSTHYSPTTSRHINKWLDGRTAPEVSQAEIDALLNNQGE